LHHRLLAVLHLIEEQPVEMIKDRPYWQILPGLYDIICSWSATKQDYLYYVWDGFTIPGLHFTKGTISLYRSTVPDQMLILKIEDKQSRMHKSSNTLHPLKNLLSSVKKRNTKITWCVSFHTQERLIVSTALKNNFLKPMMTAISLNDLVSHIFAWIV
jgi:hypothetical protein